MTDRFLAFTHSSLGKNVAALMGLPQPPQLRRAKGGYTVCPLEGRSVLLGSAPGARLTRNLATALEGMGGTLLRVTESAVTDGAAAEFAYVYDATGAATLDDLAGLYLFLQPRVARIPAGGRVVIVADAPTATEDPAQAAMAAALGGFVRSLAKECGRKGITANLLTVAKGGEAWLDGALRFLLSEHSAYVTGQTLPLAGAPKGLKANGAVAALSGKVALVTGAARGIGKAIAETLAREGAVVIGMDRPAEEAALAATMSAMGGHGIALDVTAPDAPERLAQRLGEQFGGVDIVVHNAGVTRDKLLRNMGQPHWDMVLDVNLGAILRINERLLQGVLRQNARIVCISSIGGIAGNAGQTNYAATKAAIIGYCAALAPKLAQQGMAINAVAPGFIETQMTAAIPLVNREVGRRLSALMQGGLPIDIAEAVTFLASPLAGGVNGATLRVCGQNFMGA